MKFDPYSEITMSQALTYLVHPKFGRNFYAMTLAPLMRVETKKVFAMAVGATARRLVLSYNPDWVNESQFEYVVGVLEHEALHLVLEHLPRSLRMRAVLSGRELEWFEKAIDQYASDMAANSLLTKSNRWMRENKFDEMIRPEHYGLPPDKSYEWYVRALLEKVSKNPEDMDDMVSALGGDTGGGPSDKPPVYSDWAHAHDLWNETCASLSDEERESLASELDRQTRALVKKVVHDYQKSCGRLPAHLQSVIEVVLEPPKIPWTRLLRAVVTTTKKCKWRRSTARPNRRYVGTPRLFDFPGAVEDRVFHVVFAVDTSGSMGDPELAAGFNELQHLQKADPDIRITVIEADAQVQKVYEIGARDVVDPKFHGRGGTDFNPALIEAKRHKPDIMFYYTDGFAPRPRVANRVKCPFFWLLTKDSTEPDPDWGRRLLMEDHLCE